jgi:hypothetical protein
MWVLFLALALVFQLRANYLKSTLVKKYGFQFPHRFLGMVRIAELKVNRSMTEIEELKEMISSFIKAKNWFYRFLVLAFLNFVGPHMITWWLTDGKRF